MSTIRIAAARARRLQSTHHGCDGIDESAMTFKPLPLLPAAGRASCAPHGIAWIGVMRALIDRVVPQVLK